MKEIVSQNVFLAVSSLFTDFLITLTKFRQNTTQNIGVNSAEIISKKYNTIIPPSSLYRLPYYYKKHYVLRKTASIAE